MSFIRNNIAVLAVFVLTASYAWVFGGTRSDMLPLFVPWLWAILVDIMLCFPQRRAGENSYTARERVWEALKKDPLTWVSLGFLVILIIPFINKGLCPICDYKEIMMGINPKPVVKHMPFCVNRLQQLNVLLWFGPALTMMLAVKHSLNKAGKIKLVQLIVWNGVGLAVLGYVQRLCEAPGPWWIQMNNDPDSFFSTFGYPNMAGDMFVTLFCMAMALWRNKVQACNEELAQTKVRRISKHKLFWTKHHDLIPAVLFSLSAISTLSRASIILVASAALVLSLHAGVSFLHKMKKAQRVRVSVIALVVLAALGLAVMAFMPSNVQRELDTLSTDAVLTRVTGKGQYHTRVAMEIWKDYPLFGCGGWGYKHFCIPKMTRKEYEHIQMIGGINVHNDYLQFMAEHGAIGFGCLVAIFVLLLVPTGKTWSKMANAIRFESSRKQPPQPRSFFVLPAGAFSLLVAAGCTLIHSFGDCPLRSPVVLSLFFIELAAVDGFLPYMIEHKEKE